MYICLKCKKKYMKISKVIARKIVFPILMKLKADKIVRLFSGNSVLNIMYHGVVNEEGTDFSPRHLAKKQFEEHLIYFKKNFDIITVKEAFEIKKSGVKLNRKSISISFDDGFQNNLRVALPLLEKYKIKSTIFVSSVCVDDSKLHCLWSELIAVINKFHKNEILNVDGLKFKNLVEINSGTHLIDFIKKCPYGKRDEILNTLIKTYKLDEKIESVPEEYWKLLTKEELINLSKSEYIEIGSHGDRHYNLGNINIKNAIHELTSSKLILEETINKPINMIAYPDGSYNEFVKNEAQKGGYELQMAVDYKLKEDLKDIRILNRYGISCTTSFESNMLNLNLAFNKKGF